VLWLHRGAHGSAVISAGEDGVARLNRKGRGGSGGFNRDMERWWTWWRDEFGKGEARRMNLTSSSSWR
jgi:hypothetical protein